MSKASFSRPLARLVLILCVALFAPVAALFAQSPSAVDGFDPNVNGNIYASLLQPDGKIIIAGQFGEVQPNGGVSHSRSNIARLNPDGSIDEAFGAATNGAVRALVQQADGRILVGGEFTIVNGSRQGTVTRNAIARFNADGTLDNSFDPNLTGVKVPFQLASAVYAIALQANGDIVVGGDFGFAQPPGVPTAVARKYLARFTSAGALDVGYNPNPNQMVMALAAHTDGKMLVGGGFTQFQPNGLGVVTRQRLARLNVDGSVDGAFDTRANNGVATILVQHDGKIIFGGSFTQIQPTGADAFIDRSRLARIQHDGTLDTEFSPSAGGSVSSLALEPDGSLIIGGAFTNVWARGTSTLTRNAIARFKADGAVDTTFNPNLNAQAATVLFQPDGKIVIGGYFTTARPVGASGVIRRNRVARFNSNGSLDAGFELDTGGRPLASVTLNDGRMIIAGSFTVVGGAVHNSIARISATGAVDNTYNAAANGRIFAMGYQPGSDKVIIGGEFTSVNGETRNRIARLNADGSLDSTFNPNINGSVYTIAVQSDGRFYVGGQFGTVQPPGSSEALTRPNLLRFNADGSLDSAFYPNPNSSIQAVVVQSDGKIVVGGTYSFFFLNGSTTDFVARNYLARLGTDGKVDTTYDPNLGNQVNGLALQSDGKVIVVGNFSTIFPLSPTAVTDPVVRNRIARLNTDGTIDQNYNPNANGALNAIALQADGKAVIGGYFTTLQPNGATETTTRRYIARLNTDGTVDSGYNLNLNEQPGNRVDSLRFQSDGKLLVGGSFLNLQPTGASARIDRKQFVRINADGSFDSSFELSAGGAPASVINAMVVQPDGRVVVGGSFSELGGSKTSNIARFNPEGTVDATFATSLNADGPVNALAIRGNSASVLTQVAGFAWLTTQGTLRTGFTPGDNVNLRGTVKAALVQADGKVIVVGSFTNLTNATGPSIARFNVNGTLDTAYAPAVNGDINDAVLQSDGKLIIVGGFTGVNGTARTYVARLNPDGSLDSGYNPNPISSINGIVLGSDDKAYLLGPFTSLKPNGATESISRSYIARINTDGTVDANFNPAPNGAVTSLVFQADGRYILAGEFTTVNPASLLTLPSRNHIARFNADGTLHETYDPNVNGNIRDVQLLPDGSLVIVGEFTGLEPKPGGVSRGSVTRNRIARLDGDGGVIEGFDPNANGSVTSILRQSDGGLVIGGDFTTLQPNGATFPAARNHLARLNSDGTLDTAFNPFLNGSVTDVALRPDGTLLVTGGFTGVQSNGLLVVGGAFASIGGTPTRNLALVNEDGSISGFSPQPNGAVNALLPLTDGRFLVGGAFTTLSGTTRNRVARYSASGVLDIAFDPNVSGTVNALALQADGKILIGGDFTALGGSARTNLGRVNADGTLDSTFAPSVGVVSGIAVQADGRIVVLSAGSGGTRLASRLNADGSSATGFDSWMSGITVNAMALQADGKLVTGAGYPGNTNGLSGLLPAAARFNADGSRDLTFNPLPNGNVSALALQADGRVLLGGRFTTVGGVQRVSLARVASTGTAVQTLGITADRSSLFWARAGTTGELAAATFEYSSDGRTWTALGNGERLNASATWVLAGVSNRIPASGLFYIRARGIMPSSGGTSASLVEVVREFEFSGRIPAVPVSGSTTVAAGNQRISINGFTGIAEVSIVVPAGGGIVVDGDSFLAENLYYYPSTGLAIARLANISTRGVVNGSTPLIAGFNITGDQPRSVLVRAIGPTLGVFGVENALRAAKLRVYNEAGNVILSNDGWADDPALLTAFASSGAFALPAGSADAALVATLPPGSYTVHVVDGTADGAGGIALAEVYDAGALGEGRLANLSNRGTAAVGEGAFIGGFVLVGNSTKRVLVRGVGPGLARFDVQNRLADPVVAVFDSQGRQIASNDNWSATEIAAALGATQADGAFPLDPGSKDAAAIVTLAPGAYTVHVRGSNFTTGATLLELYELP